MSHSRQPLPATPDQFHAERIGRRQFLTLSAQALSTMAAASLLPEALAASNAGNTSDLLTSTVGVENSRVLSQVCERILPATNTPGAIAAGVPDFIAGVVNVVYLDSETQRFISQLSAFSAATMAEYGTSFDQLDSARQDNRLSAMASDENNNEAVFFAELRQLTVYGYYTSELGATSEHALTDYMAPWNGDMAYADVGRMWTG